MGMYKYIRQNLQNEYKERSEMLRGNLARWRDESPVQRINRPTNLARARELGYKAKQGILLYRVKVSKGLSKRKKVGGGRKPSKSGRFMTHKKSLQSIAEDRASRKAMNCEVLNSYYAGEDGSYKFFEVILFDRNNTSILNDGRFASLIEQRGRSFRGLTSSGRKHRGLSRKSFGNIKNRPGMKSHKAAN